MGNFHARRRLGLMTAAWAKSGGGEYPWDDRLEYVESDFRQVFDTKLKPTLGMSAEMDVEFTGFNNDDCFLGCKGAGNTRFIFCSWLHAAGYGDYYVLNMADGGALSLQPSRNPSVYSRDTITLNQRAVFKAKTSSTVRELFKDGVLIGNALKYISSNSPEVSLRMFGRIWNGTTVGAFCAARAYDVKIYNSSDVVIRHYIPCIKDGIVGMWEECEGEFFHSETDTPLIAGPKI